MRYSTFSRVNRSTISCWQPMPYTLPIAGRIYIVMSSGHWWSPLVSAACSSAVLSPSVWYVVSPFRGLPLVLHRNCRAYGWCPDMPLQKSASVEIDLYRSSLLCCRSHYCFHRIHLVRRRRRPEYLTQVLHWYRLVPDESCLFMEPAYRSLISSLLFFFLFKRCEDEPYGSCKKQKHKRVDNFLYVMYFRLTTYTLDNLVINLIVRLIAYNLLSKKPSNEYWHYR